MSSDSAAGGIGWQIFVEGLSVMTRVGLHAHEHEKPQPVVLDIGLAYRGGQQGDQVESVIDYDFYVDVVSAYLTGKAHTRLLETLASEVAALSFRDFPALREIKISIHKPGIRGNALRLGISASWSRWSYETLWGQHSAESASSM